MRGIEALGYAGRKAGEIVGITPAIRAYKGFRQLEAEYGSESTRKGPLLAAAFVGLSTFAAPSLYTVYAGDRSDTKVSWVFALDMSSIGLSVMYSVQTGDYGAGLLAKLGYNTIARVAPDVAKLVRGKFLRK